MEEYGSRRVRGLFPLYSLFMAIIAWSIFLMQAMLIWANYLPAGVLLWSRLMRILLMARGQEIFRGRKCLREPGCCLSTWNSGVIGKMIQNHPLSSKIDLSRIILMGHSRGGEAVAIAAKYNRLPYFPDNAALKFDFDFSIMGIVAIAPTDKRYTRRISLENINYLSLQGSYDSDEASFFGLRQFQRVNFTDSSQWLKVGVYVHGANHGQFNSIWGRKDSGAPWNWLLNLQPIMAGDEQRQMSKIYISAFTDLIFNQKNEYRELLKANNPEAAWIPAHPITINYRSSNYQSLLTFEDELKVDTWKKGTIEAKNLDHWSESELLFRDKDTQGVNGVLLGWKNQPDEFKTGSYRVILDDTLVTSGKEEDLVLNIANFKDKNAEDTIASVADFTLILRDAANKTYRQGIKPMPLLEVQYLKLAGLNDEIYGNTWEAILEDVRIPILDLKNQINLESLKEIEFRFDQSPRGKIFINEIGIE